MSETLSDTTSINTSNVQEYKNEHLTAKVEMLPNCVANVHLTITPEASKAAYAKAIKLVSKEVSVPGFRKGKAPTDMIVKNYSKAVSKEWEEQLLRTSIIESLSLIEQEPCSNDSITSPKLIKASKDEASEVSFQLECFPNVPEVDIKQIKVHQVDPEPVAEEAINQEIETVRLHKATWEPVEGRSAEEGDYIDLTIISLDPPTSTLCENARFILQKDKMSAWMYHLVLGMNIGDTVEGTSEKDPNMEDPDNSFVPTRCSIKLEGIFKPILPELNDEFAKKLGADSLEDLNEKVKTRISRVNHRNAMKAMEGQVIEQLLTHYQFDIPLKECELERNAQYERLKNKLESSEGSPADKVRMIQEVERYTSSLPNNYRLYFMARQIAKNNNIRITEKELTDEITHHLLLSRASYDSLIDESMDPRQVQKMIYNHLLLNKTIDFIVKNAQSSEQK